MGPHTSVGPMSQAPLDRKECLRMVLLLLALFPLPASLLVERTGGRGRSPTQLCWLGFTDPGCFSVLSFTVSLYRWKAMLIFHLWQ